MCVCVCVCVCVSRERVESTRLTRTIVGFSDLFIPLNASPYCTCKNINLTTIVGLAMSIKGLFNRTRQRQIDGVSIV